MNFKFKSVLTGRREGGRDVSGERVVFLPTRGNINVYPEAVAKIGLKAGSFANIFEAEDDEGNSVMVICKGIDGVPAMIDGKLQFGKTGRQLWEKPGLGLVCRSAVGNTGVMKLSSHNVWEAANADETKKTYYTLGGGVEMEIPTGLKEEPFYTTTVFPLVFEKTEDKAPRNVDKVNHFDNTPSSVANVTNVAEVMDLEDVEDDEEDFDDEL